ncbi:GATA zinc finger domain-containing protein 14-like isoform X1 [Centruroides sculpturatus]|uniref:GATA zinc finger domain-containing protein 14-like isoform X1 n=2 Tax=Centruroides sculpturatus TaxID=218467 RepID=UPI000C6ECF02|nr:GATA zinc finger domain-containing protein 14-like isoform X1 [Centruroides sculpturatus]
MQSSGPPYQGLIGAGINYSERQYENQMNSHCHSNSYPSYQPSSPYRPHPISPQAHTHQYNSHGNHQMHSGMVYGTGHQLGPYASAPQAHFGTQTQDIYSNRRNMFSNGNRNVQQVKTAWVDSGNSGNSDLIQNFSQSSPRPTMLVNSPHMPPPSLRSPPHGVVSSTATSSLVPTHHHYRSLPVGTSPNQSPHSWSQTQIPSPSLLHSPRATPSPLPNHARSPGHNQPFSPPPTTPSPHHASTSATSHQTSQVKVASPSSSNCQTINQSGSDPLQSLQKMVMLETDTNESPMTRVNYEVPNSHNNPQTTRCYFSSVEQLAGSNPGSPYPTYYNLDQNRLCTPSSARMSTPATPTYSSAPDSVSNSSTSNDSRTSSCTENIIVNQQNGEVKHTSSAEVNSEKLNSVSKDKIINGEQEIDVDETTSNSLQDSKDKLIQKKIEISDSKENCINWNKKFSVGEDCSTNEIKPTAITSFKNKKISNDDDDDSDFCNSPQETVVEKQLKSKTILSNKRNLVIQEISVSNGPASNCGDNDSYLQNTLNCASPKWNNNESCDDSHDIEEKEHLSEENTLVFSKQNSLAGLSSQRTSTQCNLIWIRKDIKNIHKTIELSENLNTEVSNDGNEKNDSDSSDEKESSENCTNKIHDNKIPLATQKFGDFGISNFLGKEEKKESWKHPDLYVGPSPSDERSDESMSKESSIVNTSAPLKATSESLIIPLSENTPSDESKLNKKSKNTSKEKFTIKESSDTTNDDHTPSRSRSSDSPPKKKRGRPFGSKNKPKSQSDKSDKKKRKKGEVVDTKETDQKKKNKGFSGPHVHVVGTRDKPLSITVVNVAPKEEEKYVKYQKQKRDFHTGNNLHKKLGVGHTSTLSPLYDAFTKDKTWVCALCQKGSHYRNLGDLFGPYYFKEEHNLTMPSNCSAPADNVKNVQKDAAVTSKNAALNRKVRSKRKRSELVEEFIKTSMSKKSKQLKKPEGEVVSPESSSSTTVPVTFHEGNEFWIHEDCALWSHGVCLNGQRIHGLEDAVKEASVMVCSKCKLRGATLGCLNKGCTEQYHYICAVDKA